MPHATPTFWNRLLVSRLACVSWSCRSCMVDRALDSGRIGGAVRRTSLCVLYSREKLWHAAAMRRLGLTKLTSLMSKAALLRTEGQRSAHSCVYERTSMYVCEDQLKEARAP
ncbi:hypothetical protein BD626DRAFT_490427 [Schizophyllum amplum]|uniref:Secreted protein n=1 Tax=Schizophyllum amplum TaxID=97359 RepID=A0A550CJK0_9AGAR|nr:hypothetical protein BD626DRAFT_490427 [Auriculariopsis ampla]